MQHYSYLLLLFAPFVVPRVLQRWRVPTAITNFGLGALCSLLLGFFVQDETVRLLATLGIVALLSLFLGVRPGPDDGWVGAHCFLNRRSPSAPGSISDVPT